MNKDDLFKDLARAFSHSSFLVTGATGMIGRNMISLLAELNDTYNADIHITAHARSRQKAEKAFADTADRADIDFIYSDICTLDVKNNVDYIIHTAGVTGGSKQHIEFPMRTIDTALFGTKRVLDIAKEKNAKGFIYLSSLEVYGNTGFDRQYISETDSGYIDPVNVRSSYSESKRMCECMCAAYTKQYGVPAYVARLTATFGDGVDYSDNRVFAQFAKSVIERKNIVLKSTGETVRNYCDAEDAAIAFLIILKNGTAGEAYNVANTDTEISIKDLALKFIELFPESGISLEFDITDTDKLGYAKVMRNVLNSDKLSALGWTPMNTLDETINKLVKSMKKSKEEKGI